MFKYKDFIIEKLRNKIKIASEAIKLIEDEINRLRQLSQNVTSSELEEIRDRISDLQTFLNQG